MNITLDSTLTCPPNADTSKPSRCQLTPANGFTNAKVVTLYSNPNRVTAASSVRTARYPTRPFRRMVARVVVAIKLGYGF